MATLVVEDGTGLANANCYYAQADVTTYHADAGNAAWAAGSSANQIAAIIRATRAIDQMGYGRFYGTKHSSTQALQWPRDDAYDADDFELTLVPTAVKNALCEAALLELATPYVLTPTLERGGQIQKEEVAGAVSVTYFNGAVSTTQYTTVTRALAPVMTGTGLGVVRV
jgi:hypothetical protein